VTAFVVDTPIGRLTGLVTARGVASLLPDGPVPAGARRDDRHPAAREVREWFAGKRREFTVPVDLSSTPAFTRRVLERLRRIPYGRTETYGDVARAVGSPRGARAVGQAVGSNPVPVIVPCHRVLAAGGGLGGFGLGLDAKRTLLAREGRTTS